MNRFLLCLSAVVLCAMLCIGTFAADLSIGSAEDFVSVMKNSKNWDETITLTADIDLTGKKINPIGDYELPFTGTFDGAGFTIKGLSISTDSHTAGLFGVIKDATIKNLTVEGYVECTFGEGVEKFSAETKVDENYGGTGAVVGMVLSGSTLENVINKAEVLGAGNCGGVAGFAYVTEENAVTLKGCENYGIVNSTVGNIGGVFGRIYVKPAEAIVNPTFVGAVVDGCVNHADLTFTSADRQRGGGIIGYVRTNDGIITIQNCRNNGNLKGTNELASGSNIPYIGGIVGRNEVATGVNAALVIKDCINVGDITSTRITGGITAYISRGEACTANPTYVEGCVNLGNVNGSYFAAGIVTYAELNGAAVSPCYATNCLNAGNITYDFIDDLVFEPNTSNQEAVGGISARNRGLSIKNCVSVGEVKFDEEFRVLAGGLVGKMDSEMTIPCEIVDSYYLYTRMPIALSMFPNTTNTELASADVAVKDKYTTLDFDGAWTMTDKCPIPTLYAAEAANITITEGIEIAGAVKPEIVTEEVVTTAAPETTEVVSDSEGGFNALPVIIAVVAVAIIAAVVVVIIKKKK